MSPTRTARSRALAGLATFATVAAVTIPLLASPASAAVSTVTASPATYQQAAGGPVDVTANVVRTGGDTTPIRFAVVSGPDADVPNNGTLTSDGDCTPLGGATVTCTFPNTTPGVDVVRVFADSNGNGILDGGEPSSDATVTLYGPAAAVDLQPDSDSAAAGTCNAFTATVTDAGGRARPSQALRLEATLTGATAGRTLAFCDPGTTTPTSTNAGGDDTTGGTGSPTQAQGTVTTDASGKATFGIRSNQSGTATVRAYVDANTNSQFDAGEPSDVSTKTFTAGGGAGNAAQDAVSSLSVSPPAQNASIGDNVVYTVTARNAANDTTPNVVINYAITGANPATGVLTQTNNAGAATLTYTATNAGTDTITFWVNQTTSTPANGSANPGEPTATATTTVAAAPSGNSLDLTCEGTTADTSAEDCRQPLTHKSEVFTATVTKGGVPQAGIPVRFTATNTANPGLAAPVVFNTVTDAAGKAVFTLTDANAVNGTVDQVVATIPGQTTNESPGSNSDTGTVTFQAAAATSLTVTPDLLTTQTGGQSTFTATLTDQFGAPVSGANVDFSISGRNAALTGSPSLLDKTTNANGQATLTYTDTGALNAAGTDTVTAWADVVTENDTQNGSEPTDTATNSFITEPATAGTVDLDVTGTGTCGVSTVDPANDAKSYDPAPLASEHPICVLVKTAGGAPLAGQQVTFSLSGVGSFVQPDGTVLSSPRQATTDANGVARINVASTTSGAQTVTATIDGKSDTAVITYNPAATGSARNIDLTPNSGEISAGQNRELTARVTDVFGNPVAGVTVDFTETGQGVFSNGTSSQSGVTGTNGTVSVTLVSAASATGAETVTAAISAAQAPSTKCQLPANNPNTGDKAGNCSDTSTYTFKAGATAPTFIIGTNVIKAGQFTKVVITGTPGDQVQVLVKGAASQTYTVIANLTLNSGGGAALSISPSTSSNYLVRNATATAGPRFLLVKAVQSVEVAKNGDRGIFSGLVKPSVTNRVVYVYYYETGGHVALACKTLVQPDGKYRCSRSGFRAGQLIHVFAQTGADKYNAAGRSSLKDLQF